MGIRFSPETRDAVKRERDQAVTKEVENQYYHGRSSTDRLFPVPEDVHHRLSRQVKDDWGWR